MFVFPKNVQSFQINSEVLSLSLSLNAFMLTVTDRTSGVVPERVRLDAAGAEAPGTKASSHGKHMRNVTKGKHTCKNTFGRETFVTGSSKCATATTFRADNHLPERKTENEGYIVEISGGGWVGLYRPSPRGTNTIFTGMTLPGVKVNKIDQVS